MQIETFLILGMISDFWLKPAHLGQYSVIRVQILSKSCVSWPLLKLLRQRKWGHCPARWGWKSSCSFVDKCGGALLVTAGQRQEFRLSIGLYWSHPSWEGQRCFMTAVTDAVVGGGPITSEPWWKSWSCIGSALTPPPREGAGYLVTAGWWSCESSGLQVASIGIKGYKAPYYPTRCRSPTFPFSLLWYHLVGGGGRWEGMVWGHFLTGWQRWRSPLGLCWQSRTPVFVLWCLPEVERVLPKSFTRLSFSWSFD